MATSSKLYHHLTSSFLLLNRRNLTRTNKVINFTNKTSPISSLLLKSRRSFCSSSAAAAAAAEDDAAVSTAVAHPWPEWDQFVDKMRNKGYFAKTMEESLDAASSSSSYSAAAMDLNRVKNACLSFARERYDIIRSLPKEDIQTIVECGCPNLFRKAVNSAKRLRAFLRLDEGDVCGACNLRGSCDRAYIIEKDGDKARTVDIMRILMTYAVDPALHSGGTNPSMTEHVQESARTLLGELIKLSDTTIDPALPKPEVLSPKKKESSEKSREVITKSKHSQQSQNVEMKRGDWMCSNCNFLNFARNIRCLECKADGPKRVEPTTLEMKLGDWTCPKCEFMNFARNKKCHRCQEFRPKRELNPGEWECPK